MKKGEGSEQGNRQCSEGLHRLYTSQLCLLLILLISAWRSSRISDPHRDTANLARRAVKFPKLGEASCHSHEINKITRRRLPYWSVVASPRRMAAGEKSQIQTRSIANAEGQEMILGTCGPKIPFYQGRSMRTHCLLQCTVYDMYNR